jgi:hypothetical protein
MSLYVDPILGAVLMLLTALLAEKASPKWKRYLWGLFILIVIAQAALQVYTRKMESRESKESQEYTRQQNELTHKQNEDLKLRSQALADLATRMSMRIGVEQMMAPELSVSVEGGPPLSSLSSSDLREAAAWVCLNIRNLQAAHMKTEGLLFERDRGALEREPSPAGKRRLLKAQTMEAVQRNLGYRNLYRGQLGREAAAMRTELLRRIGSNAKGMSDSTFNEKVLEPQNIEEIAEDLEGLANQLRD